MSLKSSKGSDFDREPFLLESAFSDRPANFFIARSDFRAGGGIFLPFEPQFRPSLQVGMVLTVLFRNSDLSPGLSIILDGVLGDWVVLSTSVARVRPAFSLSEKDTGLPTPGQSVVLIKRDCVATVLSMGRRVEGRWRGRYIYDMNAAARVPPEPLFEQLVGALEQLVTRAMARARSTQFLAVAMDERPLQPYFEQREQRVRTPTEAANYYEQVYRYAMGRGNEPFRPVNLDFPLTQNIIEPPTPPFTPVTVEDPDHIVQRYRRSNTADTVSGRATKRRR